MKLATLSALSLCSLMATASLAEGEGDEFNRAAAPRASGPSLVDRFKGLVKGNKAADSSDTGSPGTSAAQDAPKESKPGTPTKIKDIDKVSKVSSTVIDAHCKDLVEPFGLTDSAMSLAKFQFKLKTQEFMNSSGTARPTADVKGTVHQAARQLNWLPMSVERSIGQQAHDKKKQAGDLLADDRKGEKAYAAAQRILAKVLAQVRERHPYDFTIFVTRYSAGAAEAAPGGFVYVDKDLVQKADNEPRATFAIAHEVAHVLQRHQTRELQARLTDGIDSIDGLQKVMSSASGDPKALLLRARDLKRLFMLHSEEQELQADACSVRLLGSMNPDKRGLVAAIDAFAKSLPPSQPAQRVASQTMEDVVKELGDGKFSSHPNTTVRVQNLTTMLREVTAGR